MNCCWNIKLNLSSKLKSTDPSINPWGTLHLENCPFILTVCFLLFNWFLIHKRNSPLIPWLVLRSLWLGSLLKAFWKSKYTMWTKLTLSICMLIFSKNSNSSWGSCFSKACISICLLNLPLTIFSTSLPGTYVKLTSMEFPAFLLDPFVKIGITLATF